MASLYQNQETIDGLGDKAASFLGSGFIVLKGSRLLIARYTRVDPEKLQAIVLPSIVAKF